MEDILTQVLNMCGTDLLPLVIPLVIYWIYRSNRVHGNLRKKIVLITGANSGLGEALAHVFYKEGCKLILVARRIDELLRVKAELQKIESINETFEPSVLKLDLSDLEAIPELAVKALDFYNEIDILINNAGVSYRGNILETNMKVQMDVMAVNYFGQIALTNALLPSLIKNKGHIVTISSIQGQIAIPYRSAYAASKHALQAYMDCLRSEISDIKVTVINPGYIKTSISVNAVTSTGEKYGVLDSNTAKGYSPEYVAKEILQAVIKEKKEVTIAPLIPKMAILIRTINPSLFFYIIKFWGNKKK